jgi:phenylacetate-coenzyme A ligase PaaK-like adenylate-forming protein
MAGPSEAAELHRRHTADMLTRSPAFIERLRWTPTRLHDEREDALRRLLRVALHNSPWHARRLSGVDPARFRVEDIAGLPSMTKSDLMDHFDEIVTDHRLNLALLERHLTSLTTDTYLLGRYHGVASGGSSGQRGVFVYDWDAWISFYLSLQRSFLRDWHQDPSLDGVDRRVAVVAAGRASHMSSALGQTFSSPDTEIRNFPVTVPLERIVDDLNQWQPTILQGYSSMLNQLARGG